MPDPSCASPCVSLVVAMDLHCQPPQLKSGAVAPAHLHVGVGKDD